MRRVCCRRRLLSYGEVYRSSRDNHQQLPCGREARNILQTLQNITPPSPADIRPRLGCRQHIASLVRSTESRHSPITWSTGWVILAKVARARARRRYFLAVHVVGMKHTSLHSLAITMYATFFTTNLKCLELVTLYRHNWYYKFQ